MPFEEDMCGKGMMCQWQQAFNSNKPGEKERDEERRGGVDRKKYSWSKSGRGRHGERRGGGRWLSGHQHHHHQQQQQQLHHHHPRRFYPTKPRDVVLSLRPVNIKGNRARGMRAPKNTNQFLMHEKYQLMHMRSDSIGTDTSSGSDSDMDFTDMDSYLGVLENARGALLDENPDPRSSDSPPPTPVRVLPRQLAARQQQLSLFACGEVVLQEESMQYFPSEDDMMQSLDFMQKDFIEFCDTLTDYSI